MDVKISFLNGYHKEGVYMEKPKGFIDHNTQDHIFKLKKAL